MADLNLKIYTEGIGFHPIESVYVEQDGILVKLKGVEPQTPLGEIPNVTLTSVPSDSYEDEAVIEFALSGGSADIVRYYKASSLNAVAPIDSSLDWILLPGWDIGETSGTLNLSGLAAGEHKVFINAKNLNGQHTASIGWKREQQPQNPTGENILFSDAEIVFLQNRFKNPLPTNTSNARVNTYNSKINGSVTFIKDRANTFMSKPLADFCWPGPALYNTTAPLPNHSSSNTYNSGTWVLSGSGSSRRAYQAVQNVPSGISITNTSYWNTYGEVWQSNKAYPRGSRVRLSSSATLVFDAWKDVPAGVQPAQNESARDRGWFDISQGSGRVRGTNYENLPIGNIMKGAFGMIWDTSDPNVGDASPPHQGGIQPANAALRYLFDTDLSTSEKSAILNKLRDYWRFYADRPVAADFSNTQRWVSGQVNDANPGFLVAPALYSGIKAYFLLRNLLPTTSEWNSLKADFETYAFHFADYFSTEANMSYDTVFGGRSNRLNKTWSISSGRLTFDERTHDGGWPIFSFMKWLNNRRACMSFLAGAVASIFEYKGHSIVLAKTAKHNDSNSETRAAYSSTSALNTRIKEIAKLGCLSFEEHIGVGSAPDGTLPDFERQSPSGEETGFQYNVTVMSAMGELAQVRMKMGVFDLMDLKSNRKAVLSGSTGVLQNVGTAIGYEDVLINMCNYVARAWSPTRYIPGTTQVIDGLNSGGEYPADIEAMTPNRYYKNTFMESCYKRTRTGIRAYTNFHNYGQSRAETGGFGTHVFNNFFFAEMPTLTKPTTAPNPVI